MIRQGKHGRRPGLMHHLKLWSGLVMLANPTAHAPDSGWPAVQPLHAEFAYVRPQKEGDDAPFLTYIQDPKGNKVYRFECHDGGYYDEGYDLHFTGDLQCVLFPFKGDTVSAVNVLAADTHAEQSKDWWNRGRILARQLQGECLDYPEYSTARHFRLRGMAFTLSIQDIVWSPAAGDKEPTLAKFTLVVDAAPDADAKSPVAELADGPMPPKSCYP